MAQAHTITKQVEAIINDRKDIVGYLAFKGKHVRCAVYNGGNVYIETMEGGDVLSVGADGTILSETDLVEVTKFLDKRLAGRVSTPSDSVTEPVL